MIKSSDIWKSVKDKLTEISHLPIYTIETPEGYKKPSFFVELDYLPYERESKYAYKTELNIVITYVMEKANSNEAMGVYDLIRKTFRDRLKVGEDYIAIYNINRQDIQDDVMEITLYTSRIDFEDDDYIEQEKINDIKINVKEGI